MSKNDILLTSINNFYDNEKNKSTLLTILDKSSGISLRNLEWFITNYAKKNHTSYQTGDGKLFVGLRSFPIQYPGHLTKFKQPWHN